MIADALTPAAAATASAPPMDPWVRAGRQALVGSFFVPPWGIVHGLWLHMALGRTPGDRTLARLALVNGVVGTVVIWKAIVWAPVVWRFVVAQWEGV
jgi:hypothetical protein